MFCSNLKHIMFRQKNIFNWQKQSRLFDASSSTTECKIWRYLLPGALLRNHWQLRVHIKQRSNCQQVEYLQNIPRSSIHRLLKKSFYAAKDAVYNASIFSSIAYIQNAASCLHNRPLFIIQPVLSVFWLHGSVCIHLSRPCTSVIVIKPCTRILHTENPGVTQKETLISDILQQYDIVNGKKLNSALYTPCTATQNRTHHCP